MDQEELQAAFDDRMSDSHQISEAGISTGSDVPFWNKIEKE